MNNEMPAIINWVPKYQISLTGIPIYKSIIFSIQVIVV